MGKTIIISEKQAKSMLLKESVLLDTLPNDIKRTLKKNETCLGLSPVFPEEYVVSFNCKITVKRFEEIIEIQLILVFLLLVIFLIFKWG